MDADIGVIGVGTMGSMAMWELAKRGVSVLGFEQFGVGHDRSAAGGESRIFRTAYMEGQEYVPLLMEAKRQWRRLEEDSGKELLTLNGGLMIGDPDLQVMKNVLKSIDEYDLEHEILEKQKAAKSYPQHRLFEGEIMILDKNAGFIRPELAVISAAQYAKDQGAKIHPYTKVNQILPSDDCVLIQTDNAKYNVGQVLVTTGSWTGILLPELKEQISTKRLVLTWFAPKDISRFKPEHFPAFARMRKGFRLTGTPTIEGSMVKASNTKEPEIVQDPNHLNRDVKLKEIQEVGDAVQELIPGLYPNPVRASVYMDAYTNDDHSLVGRLPETDNTVIMSGFSGHGFKMSPVMGKIAADLLIEGKTNFPIDHLSPKRNLLV